jgi:hypothetical protein
VPKGKWSLLASEVTPGLLAEAEPDAHKFLCHGLINGRSNG